MNTIFDKSRLAEDAQTVEASEEAAGMDKIEKLLRKYNTEIFEPESGELEEPAATDIDGLMKQTALTRQGIKAPSGKASEFAPTEQAGSEQATFAAGKVNTFPWRVFALAASVLLVCGVAFTVILTEYGHKNNAPTGPKGQPPVAVDPAVKPVPGISNGLSPELAPTHITRGKSDGIDIYSPRGASFTDKPVVKIGGDPALTYTVTILDVENKAVGKQVEMLGNTQRPWKDFTDAPLAEDESYALVVRYNGRIVNGLPDYNRFRLLPKQKRDAITLAFKQLDAVKDEPKRAFSRAEVLYKNGCYSEALLMVESIEKYADNPSCRKLHDLCLQKLNLSHKKK